MATTQQMTQTEMRELDAWIAEHVMGWHRMTNAQAMGIVDLEGLGLSDDDNEFLRALDDKWYGSENKPVYDVASEYDCGQCNTGFTPTTDSRPAMAVLAKCLSDQSELSFGDPFISKDGAFYWIRTCKNNEHIEGCAETLELAICLFAKKIFTK